MTVFKDAKSSRANKRKKTDNDVVIESALYSDTRCVAEIESSTVSLSICSAKAWCPYKINWAPLDRSGDDVNALNSHTSLITPNSNTKANTKKKHKKNSEKGTVVHVLRD